MVLRDHEIFHSPEKFVAWCEEKRRASWAGAPGEQVSVVLPELPIFPLLPPRFVPASCASTALAELSSDWSRNWSRLKITFWGWWEGPKHNCRVQQGGIERSGEVESGGSCLGYQPPSEEIPKAQPVLMWSPPSSCAPDTAICSVLSLLASPLTQVLLPQLSCCWS